MIKMSYEQKRYFYEGEECYQPYDININIEMDEDSCITDIVAAMAKLMNMATYQVTVKKLREACDALEEEYGVDGCII